MSLDDILIFAEVVDSGSFTAAADALGMPKSNVSRSITRLEKSLGVRLLERTTRRLALTEIGRAYYGHSIRVRDELEASKATVEKLSVVPRGQLRVCASVSVGQNLIAQHLGEFVDTYPEVKLDFQLTNRRVDLLEEGFDVVIRVGHLADSNLVVRQLCTHQLRFYASPTYLNNAHHPLEKPADLVGHACLYMNAVTRRPKWTLHSGGKAEEIEFKPQVTSDDFQVLRDLTASGGGVTLLPDYMCTAGVSNGQLVGVLEDWIGGEVEFYTLVPSRRGITPKIRAFLDHVHLKCRTG